jgi:predicted RNA binding protein YcfA (HicA-like mRNA interferase family)
MTKPAPIDGKKLVKLLEKLGYVNKTTKGTYMVFERPGNVKNLMIRQLSELTPALLNEILMKVSDQTDIPIENLKNMMNEP